MPLSQSEQKLQIRNLISAPLKEGDTWYVVATEWYSIWEQYVDNEDSAMNPGPIKNDSIISIENPSQLKENLLEQQDYVLLPQKAYDILFEYYGGGPPLPRKVISVGSSHAALQIEIYPILVNIYTCVDNMNNETVTSTTTTSTTTSTITGSVCNTPLMKYYMSVKDFINDVLSLLFADHSKYSKEEGDQQQQQLTTLPLLTGNKLTTDKTDVDTEGGYWRFFRLDRTTTTLSTILGGFKILDLLVEVEVKSADGTLEYPRSHILNKWRQSLKVGDIVDAIDNENKWYEAQILSISSTDGSIKIHYFGWLPKFDTIVLEHEINRMIQPLYSHSRNWRVELEVDDKVEVRIIETSTKEISKWFQGTITKVNDINNTIEVLITDRDMKKVYNIYSEDICPMYTHIKKPTNITSNTSSKSTALALSTNSTTSTSTSLVSNLYTPLGSSSARGSTSTSSWHSSRSHVRGKTPVKGAVGLTNLGNTCFMASMLQCLSNTKILTEIFLSEEYKKDINISNPLGKGGKIANVYAKLLRDMWSDQYSVVVPDDFKHIIGEFASQFAGYQQQDSQEFMCFLLDGLHEDLNRITNKISTNAIESRNRDDNIVARESWRRYLLRNDSILVDSCFGLSKSHVTCTGCGNVSVTFEPFNNLSLPIPVTNTRKLTVTLFPLPLGSPPLEFILELPVTDTIKQMKEAIIKTMNGRLQSQSQRLQLQLDNNNANNNENAEPSMDVDVEVEVEADNDSPSSFVMKFPSSIYVDVQMCYWDVYKASYGTHVHTTLKLIAPVHRISIILDDETDNVKPTTKREIHDQLWELNKAAITSTSTYNSFENKPYELYVLSHIPTTMQILSQKEPLSYDDEPISINNGDILMCVWKTEAYHDDHYDSSAFDRVHIPGNCEGSSSSNSTSTDGTRSLSLLSCFDKYMEREQLAPEQTIYCSKCKQHLAPLKKMDIWTAPEILILHLKRFQHIPGQYMVHRDKITDLVDFPIVGLDLSSYIKGENHGVTAGSGTGSGSNSNVPPALYDLYGVSEHSGGLGGGHYTAVCKNFVDEKWYSFNDSHVSEVNPEEAVTPRAYVLFYQRREHHHDNPSTTATNNSVQHWRWGGLNLDTPTGLENEIE
eukprot:gene2523-4905_t